MGDTDKIAAETKRRTEEYETKEKSKKFKERKVNSDASENALVKFY